MHINVDRYLRKIAFLILLAGIILTLFTYLQVKNSYKGDNLSSENAYSVLSIVYMERSCKNQGPGCGVCDAMIPECIGDDVIRFRQYLPVDAVLVSSMLLGADYLSRKKKK